MQEVQSLSPEEELAEKIVEKAYKKVGYVRRPLRRKIRSYILCALATILITIAALFIGLYSIIWICVNGPSEKARQLFVASVKETSAVGFLAEMFVPKAEVQYILTMGETEEINENTDKDLIHIDDNTNNDSSNNSNSTDVIEPSDKDNDGVEIVDIVGSTYRGKLCIIKDPTRVKLGISGEYGEDESGKTLKKIAESYNALIAINASGFEDEGGDGNGAEPTGLVIYDGSLAWGEENVTYDIIGLDNNGILVLDKMTSAEAIASGIKYAVSFGPVLVKNGQAAYRNGGMNPRTAIGQRADGAILLLVIEGRQVSSMGATLRDLTNIMLEYDAVNAANLDGGSSSSLYYDGDFLIEGSYIFGVRKIPNAFIVTD